jgi:hypothetical protein
MNYIQPDGKKGVGGQMKNRNACYKKSVPSSVNYGWAAVFFSVYAPWFGSVMPRGVGCRCSPWRFGFDSRAVYNVICGESGSEKALIRARPSSPVIYNSTITPN